MIRVNNTDLQSSAIALCIFLRNVVYRHLFVPNR